MLYLNPQENVLIVGRMGSGKHLFAIQRLVNSLAQGDTAVVFDWGGLYDPVVRALGGTLVKADPERNIGVDRFGSMPLTVYDLTRVPQGFDIAKLPGLPEQSAATFMLVDEVSRVDLTLPGIWGWLKRGAGLNGSFCGVMQSLDAVDFEVIPENCRIQRIERFAPVAGETLQPGQLVRHQDGGIYRYHSTARHTDDQDELVMYEHVWPFTSGQMWARPAHEWASRFTPISNDELRAAQQTPRAQAQAAITNAKAARRAEEARRKAAIESDYHTLAFAAPRAGLPVDGRKS